MGFGSFFWGSLSDRFGTRAVVLAGGVLLGIGLIAASQADNAWQFQLLFGITVGLAVGQLLCADDRDGDALVHRQPQPGRGTGLGGHGHSARC